MYLAEGFDDYLSKPIESTLLETMIMQYLPQDKIIKDEAELAEEASVNQIREYLIENKIKSNEVKYPSEAYQNTVEKDTFLNKEEMEEELLAFETEESGTQESTVWDMEESETIEQQTDTEELIDMEVGLEYSAGMEEMYQEFLTMFCDMKEEKKPLMESSFSDKDWGNYRIYIHALKSTSLSIGGKILSEQALALEMAAKEEDIEYIMQHHEEVMNLYDATVEKGRDILEKMS